MLFLFGSGGDLDGHVSVLFLGLEFQHRCHGQFDDGDGNDVAFSREHLGHAQFFAN
jgi:hypothetical protein